MFYRACSALVLSLNALLAVDYEYALSTAVVDLTAVKPAGWTDAWMYNHYISANGWMACTARRSDDANAPGTIMRRNPTTGIWVDIGFPASTGAGGFNFSYDDFDLVVNNSGQVAITRSNTDATNPNEHLAIYSSGAWTAQSLTETTQAWQVERNGDRFLAGKSDGSTLAPGYWTGSTFTSLFTQWGSRGGNLEGIAGGRAVGVTADDIDTGPYFPIYTASGFPSGTWVFPLGNPGADITGMSVSPIAVTAYEGSWLTDNGLAYRFQASETPRRYLGLYQPNTDAANSTRAGLVEIPALPTHDSVRVADARADGVVLAASWLATADENTAKTMVWTTGAGSVCVDDKTQGLSSNLSYPSAITDAGAILAGRGLVVPIPTVTLDASAADIAAATTISDPLTVSVSRGSGTVSTLTPLTVQLAFADVSVLEDTEIVIPVGATSQSRVFHLAASAAAGAKSIAVVRAAAGAAAEEAYFGGTVDPSVPQPTIAVTDQVNEDSDLTGAFTVTLPEPAPVGGTTITYTVSGNAVAGNDFTALSGSVLVTQGLSTATIAVNVTADVNPEEAETIIVTVAGGTATMTIPRSDVQHWVFWIQRRAVNNTDLGLGQLVWWMTSAKEVQSAVFKIPGKPDVVADIANEGDHWQVEYPFWKVLGQDTISLADLDTFLPESTALTDLSYECVLTFSASAGGGSETRRGSFMGMGAGPTYADFPALPQVLSPTHGGAAALTSQRLAVSWTDPINWISVVAINGRTASNRDYWEGQPWMTGGTNTSGTNNATIPIDLADDQPYQVTFQRTNNAMVVGRNDLGDSIAGLAYTNSIFVRTGATAAAPVFDAGSDNFSATALVAIPNTAALVGSETLGGVAHPFTATVSRDSTVTLPGLSTTFTAVKIRRVWNDNGLTENIWLAKDTLGDVYQVKRERGAGGRSPTLVDECFPSLLVPLDSTPPWYAGYPEGEIVSANATAFGSGATGCLQIRGIWEPAQDYWDLWFKPGVGPLSYRSTAGGVAGDGWSIMPPMAPTNSVLPTVTGAVNGGAFAASTGTWADANGDTLTYSYQFFGASSAAGTGRASLAVAGATNAISGVSARFVQVEVTANDGNGGLTTATSTPYHRAVNVTPAATAQALTTSEDTAISTITLTGTDGDPEDTSLSIAVVAAPTHGTLSGSGANRSYVPSADYSGSDSFTFTVTDALGAVSAAATVSITVTPANDMPVSLTLPTFSGASVLGAVQTALPGTWSDVDSDPLSFAYQWQRATNGSGAGAAAIPSATNSTYNLTSDDQATWLAVRVIANDGTAEVAAQSAWRKAINQAPTGLAQAIVVGEDAASATSAITTEDLDGDVVTVTITTLPTKGTATYTSGVLTYVPAANAVGADSATVTLNDGATTTDIVVAISITAINDVPGFTAGTNVTVSEDAGATAIAGWVAAISPGPADEAAQTVAFAVTNDNASLFSVPPTVTADGTLSFSPAADANGLATLSVVASDSAGASAAAVSRTITVTAINDAPALAAGSPATFALAVAEDAGIQKLALTGLVLTAGPADENAQTVQVIRSSAADGRFFAQPSFERGTDGIWSVRFGVQPDQQGAITITARATDSGGASSADGLVAITLTVNPVNDAPTLAVGPTVMVAAGQTATFAAWAEFADPDGDAVSRSVSTSTPVSAASLAADGSLTVAAADTAVDATVTLTATVSDGSLTTNRTFQVVVVGGGSLRAVAPTELAVGVGAAVQVPLQIISTVSGSPTTSVAAQVVRGTVGTTALTGIAYVAPAVAGEDTMTITVSAGTKTVIVTVRLLVTEPVQVTTAVVDSTPPPAQPGIDGAEPPKAVGSFSLFAAPASAAPVTLADLGIDRRVFTFDPTAASSSSGLATRDVTGKAIPGGWREVAANEPLDPSAGYWIEPGPAITGSTVDLAPLTTIRKSVRVGWNAFAAAIGTASIVWDPTTVRVQLTAADGTISDQSLAEAYAAGYVEYTAWKLGSAGYQPVLPSGAAISSPSAVGAVSAGASYLFKVLSIPAGSTMTLVLTVSSAHG